MLIYVHVLIMLEEMIQVFCLLLPKYVLINYI